MPQLLINWSINNRPTSGDQTQGEIVTSHYDSGDKQLYILGKEDVDTDEYDDHVLAHEWGHYFEANFSRSDSLGEEHSTGSKLDPRVAFGEGFGNAFSGMALDDPNYIDTAGAKQASVNLYMDVSNANGDPASIGWFSEDSVQYILYSLYKGFGFQPLYDVFVNDQKVASSYTTIYAFASFLKARNPDKLAAINALLAAKNITQNAVDEWDSTATETNDGGDPQSLPVYTKLTVGAPAVPICTNDEFGGTNKLLNRKFVFFQAADSRSYTLEHRSTRRAEFRISRWSSRDSRSARRTTRPRGRQRWCNTGRRPLRR